MPLQRPRPLRRRRRRIDRAVSARRGPLKAIGALDQRLLVTLRTRAHSELSERLFGALGSFGEWGLGWLAIGIAGAALDSTRRRGWLAAAAAGPASVPINYLAKFGIGRERPLIEDHPMLARAPSKLSFPSAHATSSVAAATALGRVAPELRAPFALLAAGVCVGRPFLGMHYPSDVLAGVLLGRELGRHWPLPGVPLRRNSRAELWAR